MAGILAFRSPKELWIIVLLFWGLLPFTIYRWLSTPLINTFLVAILFGLIFVLLKYIRKFPKIKTIVDLLGRYSLEIYLGNCLAMLLKLHTLESKGIGIVSYFVLTIVFSCVLIFINKLLQKQVKV